MKLKTLRTRSSQRRLRCLIAVATACLILPGNALTLTRPGGQDSTQAVKIPAEQLDSLVAPIALYPDNLLSQTLVASTYPLEIIQLQ
ncbi:MAG TPA: DUF3300 domain-containing protein, partial [Pyrinomonadaceae bacterium]|nr:DUF3300 domain-containing protein [Pyrinomonadaceae bacterium]